VKESDGWWSSGSLGNGPIVLEVFAADPPAGSGHVGRPVLGIAALRERVAFIRPEYLGHFIREHAFKIFSASPARSKAAPFFQEFAVNSLVCSIAAPLHWVLHHHLTELHDEESTRALWDVSRCARLVDLQLLDWHVGRLRGQRTSVRTLEAILRDWTAADGLPEYERTRHEIIVAFSGGLPDPGTPALQRAAELVQSVWHAYQEMYRTASLGLLDLVIELRRLRRFRSAEFEGWTDAEVRDELIRAHGLLGVGIDVQAAIAFWPASQVGIRVDHGRWNEFRRWSEDRLRQAAMHLKSDPAARDCFRWSDGSPGIKLAADGTPLTDNRNLQGWLRTVSKRLFDYHNCPAFGAEMPPQRPEFWGAWVSCHPQLQYWRTLTRSGRSCVREPQGGRICPVYHVVPFVRSDHPDLTWLRSSPLRVCRPRDGHRFLVCRLPGLKVRCFAVLCRARGYALNGRLWGYFLRGNRGCFRPFRTWLEAVAGELYVVVHGARRGSAKTENASQKSTGASSVEVIGQHDEPRGAAVGPDSLDVESTKLDDRGGEPSQTIDRPEPVARMEEMVRSKQRRARRPVEPADAAPDIDAGQSEALDIGFIGGRLEQAASTFLPLKKTHREEYRRWVRLTRALLESLPVGLPVELLRTYLALEHDIELDQDELGRLVETLTAMNDVAYEIAGFLTDETLELLAYRLDVALETAIALLCPGQHAETVDARVRSALLEWEKPSPVKDTIQKWVEQADARLREQGIEPKSDLVRRLLLRRGLTLGGRLTDRTFCAQARHDEYKLTVDELLKSIAFALACNGFKIVAVANTELVLEVADEDAIQEGFSGMVARVIRQAQKPFLGRFAAPCRCRVQDEW
jgi:hypothetical protein